MRFTSVLKKLVGVTQLYVRGLVMDRDDDLSVEVRPTWRQARCAGCGRRAPQYDHPRSVGRWQDLNWGPVRIYLVYRCRRVTCARCGGRPCNELVPWAAAGTKCTHRMEELTAFLARQTDRTSVTRLLGIAWRTVGRIVRRVGVARLDPDRYTGLTRIGVDECSYRKRHHYLTVVLNHDTGKVVWAAKGKNSEALCTFFDLIGPEQCASIHTVTIDMSAAYEKAVRERLPPATILFDRFHVQQLSTDAVEAVRRDQQRKLRNAGDSDEAKVTKGTRFALLKNPWNLTLKRAGSSALFYATTYSSSGRTSCTRHWPARWTTGSPSGRAGPSMSGSRGRAGPSWRPVSGSRGQSEPGRRVCSPTFGSA